MGKPSMLKFVCAFVFSICFAGTAQAQFDPKGHIHMSGHHTNSGTDMFSSFGKIYEYTGGNPKWAQVLNLGAPRGVGVVALPPNDRRCYLWMTSTGIVGVHCETSPGAGDWTSSDVWFGPHQSQLSAMVVLGVRGPLGAAAGQVPMIFGSVGGTLWFKRYTGGAWSGWIMTDTFLDGGGQGVNIHSIGAAWEPGPNCGPAGSNVASVVVAGGTGYQRVTVSANSSGGSATHTLLGNPVQPGVAIDRVVPIPSTGCSGASTFGNALFVQNGQLWKVQTPSTVKGMISTPMPVRGHHVGGTANGFFIRWISTTGWAFQALFSPTNPNPAWIGLD